MLPKRYDGTWLAAGRAVEGAATARPTSGSRSGSIVTLMLAGMVALAIVGGEAMGQGAGGGPMPGGGGAEGPRGSVGLLEDTGEGMEDFGGIGGGLGRGGGGVGSPSRSELGGAPGSESEELLGPPIGASGTIEFGQVPGMQGAPIGGRIGPQGIRSPPGAFQPPTSRLSPERPEALRGPEALLELEPPDVDPIAMTPSPLLAVPGGPEDPGPADGLTLDAAIEHLLARNLGLMALRLEITKAEADVLTAGLRSNPIVFADAQLVPYGWYSEERPGGQIQYDVNLTIPVDVSRKRRARIAAARAARSVTEAQLQDATRSLIDQLYTAYVNVLATRQSLRFGRAYLDEVQRELADRERQHAEGGGGPEVLDFLRGQREQARFQVQEEAMTMARATRGLALLLALPPSQAESVRVFGRLRELHPLPGSPQELARMALAHRPDLVAYRLGEERARADLDLARANRLSDVYLVYQPYTLQDNRWMGLDSVHSYAVGVNAALPIFNRNQGNIARAGSNVTQTSIERADLELRVRYEVEEAARNFELSQRAVLMLEREVLPAARRARDVTYGQYREDESKVNEYLDALKDEAEAVEEYRNVLVLHRRSMLDLNTAVGVRLLP